MGCAVKIQTYDEFLKKYGLADGEGMCRATIYLIGRLCVASAVRSVLLLMPVPEVKEVSCYVSRRRGGYGCGRDVIEQTLRAQGKWLMNEKAFGW